MPQKAGTDAPGVLQHIVVRGNNREKIFSMIQTVMISTITLLISAEATAAVNTYQNALTMTRMDIMRIVNLMTVMILIQM